MEILSAAFDQASSPRRPGYALFGMLLAIAALLTCICELIYKGRKNNVVWRKRGCYMLFGSVIEPFGLVGGITQCVCSIVQYVCYIRRTDNPIKLSLLPAIFLICLIATRLSRKAMQTTDETDWLGDSSFSNIQVTHLSDCSTCLSLPPVGRLPALKELYIERMKSIKSIGVEFYRGNGASLIQPFQSLKKLEFNRCRSWRNGYLVQLCKRIDSREIRDMFGPKKLEKSLLKKKFKLTLLTLDAVLDDAHQKEFEIPSIGNWLDELREAVYDAGVLLDEIEAEALGLKMAAEDQSVVTQVWNFLSVPFSRFDQRLNDRIKELYHRLKFLANEKDILGLQKGVRKVSQMPTTCLVDKSFVVGRDDDKEELIRLLISDAEGRNNVSVITIVGMAGIGKTTLAQLVCNDERVKEHFDIQAWVCVSEDFDAVRVTKTLLESITSTVCDITDLNFVQVQLKHEVRGKRFLFVLDDLWNENYHDWNLQQVPFLYAAGGSKVVITTRSETVASIVRNVPTHYLEPLSDEDCWSLILKHALGDSNPTEHSNIRETDRETAIRKCNGLPLIARALGGLLRATTSGSEEWHHILHTNIWELPSIARILPICLLQQLRQKGRESHQKRRSDRTEVLQLHKPSSHIVLEDLLPALQCLRVLSLSRYKNITQIPDSISKHLHLRYIDFSYTAIKRLPDIVCNLYNLQTLLLLGCSSLVELPTDMRKLINLLHLDIGGTCVKEMPMQMGRLKRLRTLTAFVLGKSIGSVGIGELGQFLHLRGKLSILNLQNVVNPMDASRANLKDKKHLSEVELAWGREDTYDSIKERHVLESLQPSVNLAKLTIRFYGGTRFPDWLGDSSFSNIQVMRLTDCSTCLWLPPVGRLPALKELYIERMKSVMSIGVEFYRGNEASSSQPFQSLKKLEFKEMPEWEEWLSSPGRGQCPDFLRLEELNLEKCPKLRGNLPDHLPCLRKLSVSDCEVLHERATRTRWIPWSLIVNTESLRQSLEELKIVRCPGLSSLLETESLSSLSKLEIQFFSRRECLRLHLSNCLLRLSLVNCGSLLSFPRNGLPTSLTLLEIEECRRLEFLSHEMMAKLTSLQELRLRESCDSLRSFPLGVFPKLSFLIIGGIKNLESLSIGEGAEDENLTHLNNLYIYKCPNLVSFPHGGLPTPNLAHFSVWGNENLKLLPDRIHTLTALRYLHIGELPNVESFAEGGLPPNLESFDIKSSEDVLEALLKEQLLPITLHRLIISKMKSLKYLEGKGLQHLTCLQELRIHDCDSLEFLPKEGLPASLSFLSIKKCSSLEKRCQEKTGEEWVKIAHIPCIQIDDQVII
ncbi:hypothetical protein DVH24_015895 [Malus domestica]|uniref:Disease resistance RPP13-like protein 1 n=1 Tax=Malus domestica TaxID=3750 RepID=A0A498JDQ4_MALDO|nr:hypothetical protein DVH24_015895 [Malus domestica]